MKKLLVILAVFATSVQAGPWHHGPHPHRTYWVAPAIIGGIIGYELSRPHYTPASVYVAPQPVYVPSLAQPSVPNGYRQEQILDANCNCYRLVLVPN
jgi:hypothetical protein